MSGYGYNNIEAEDFKLGVVTKGRLLERGKELYDAIYKIFEKRFGAKTGERDSEEIYSAYFRNGNLLIGLHWSKQDKMSVIVVGLNNY